MLVAVYFATPREWPLSTGLLGAAYSQLLSNALQDPLVSLFRNTALYYGKKWHALDKAQTQLELLRAVDPPEMAIVTTFSDASSLFCVALMFAPILPFGMILAAGGIIIRMFTIRYQRAWRPVRGGEGDQGPFRPSSRPPSDHASLTRSPSLAIARRSASPVQETACHPRHDLQRRVPRHAGRNPHIHNCGNVLLRAVPWPGRHIQHGKHIPCGVAAAICGLAWRVQASDPPHLSPRPVEP